MDRIIKKERKNWFYSYNMIFEQDISSQAKLIYLYLCRCADEEGQSFPSINTIAGKCSISRSATIRAIKELMDIGLLAKEKRTRADNSQTSNLYCIFDTPNSITENPPSVTQTPPQCHTDTPPSVTQTPHEVLPNIKDYPYKDNQSVSQSDGQTEPCSTVLDKLQLDELRKAYPSDAELIDDIELNIYEMSVSNNTVIAGEQKPKSLIITALGKLTYWHVEMLLTRYKVVAANTDIKNHKRYMQNMIYNIAFENNLKVENIVKYAISNP